MSDVPEHRAEIFHPLRVRWPQLFGQAFFQGATTDAVPYLVEQTRGVDERVLAAYVRARVGSDTPCRRRPSLWMRFLGDNHLCTIVEDLHDLQRRFAALRLVSDSTIEDSTLIAGIVAAAEERAIQ